ncbi:MAG: HAD-IIIA family hydrolase, partial [Chitinivibrionales bacterium]|nr:HAD-IIIA family hydrolase [Chitinivibrionales bacterium]
VIQRPKELSTDEATTEAVMLHFAEEASFGVLVTLQATSPLTKASDLDKAMKAFSEEQYDSLLTAVRSKRFYWSTDGKPINYIPAHRPRRQDFDGSFVENGAFYITKRSILLNHRCRLGGKIGIYEMPSETAVEIDEPKDWEELEFVLNDSATKQLECRTPIRMLICDVDGTLTDGGMYYSAEGEVAKKFNTRDAMGLSLLQQKGILVLIVTRENSPAVEARMKKLGITEYYPGISRKQQFLEDYFKRFGYCFDEVAFIGDDLNDLECLKKAGFAACPADAVAEVRAVCDYRAGKDGGHGAVREICDLLLSGYQAKGGPLK